MYVVVKCFIFSAFFILTTKTQIIRTDVTNEELCKELKERAYNSQEFRLFCTPPEGPIRNVKSQGSR